MARFDWRRAVAEHSVRVMGHLHAAEACRNEPALAARERARAQALAEHAHWLARGYGYRHRLRRRRAPSGVPA